MNSADNSTIKAVKLGVNGLGRIGKLTVWRHVARKAFDELVVNVGREVGSSLEDVAHYLERDSTYGSLSVYLRGHTAKESVVQDVNETEGVLVVDGVRIKVLR